MAGSKNGKRKIITSQYYIHTTFPILLYLPSNTHECKLTVTIIDTY